MNETSSITEAKKVLRGVMRLRLASISQETRESASNRICERLRTAPEWQDARGILGYVAMPSEPDVLPALREAAAAGRVVGIPRWNAESGLYEAARLPPSDLLKPGPFGVPEPPSHYPSVPFERLDLILVPGLAFDRCGRRLGRGKGFFDRLLACASHARRWGVAFDLQLVTEVPAALHDANLHAVVTPESFLPAHPARRTE